MLKFLITLALAFISCQSNAMVPTSVAMVNFIIGQVDCYDVQGQKRSLSTNQAIYEGERVVTHEDARIMLKMSDNAMISLHPSSDLSINAYYYDRDNALNNHIDLKLNAGSVRSVTGYAGQENKDSYRLTTPLVAVGIRGTDFMVQTDDSMSRAALISGAIAVVSLQSDCQSAPSHCSGAMLLDETHKNMMIEYQKGATQLQVVPIRIDLQQASSQQSSDGKTGALALSNKSELPIASLTSLNTQATQGNTQSAAAPSSSFTWIANTDATTDKSDKVIKLVNAQGAYWVASAANTSVPLAGTASLSLSQVQLFVNGQSVAVQASSPYLNLNFDARQFNTGMQLNSSALTQVANLNATGFIRENGRFYSTQGADVSGLLASNGTEAAYLFNLYHLNQLATGTAVWQK
jgi:hypothetical protein